MQYLEYCFAEFLNKNCFAIAFIPSTFIWMKKSKAFHKSNIKAKHCSIVVELKFDMTSRPACRLWTIDFCLFCQQYKENLTVHILKYLPFTEHIAILITCLVLLVGFYLSMCNEALQVTVYK